MRVLRGDEGPGRGVVDVVGHDHELAAALDLPHCDQNGP
jgi:hypothetical protein